MEKQGGKALHETIDFIGMKTHATAVGFVQLSVELVRAGVLTEDAIDRVKEAIFNDIALSRPNSRPKEAFESDMRRRLDRLFLGQVGVSRDSPDINTL